MRAVDMDAAEWWRAMGPSLRPFLVDAGAEALPLPVTMGGPAAWAPPKDALLASGGNTAALVAGGMRAAVVLAPGHHLLLRLWAEAEGGGVLAHIATDFWPALFHVDAWLGSPCSKPELEELEEKLGWVHV